MNNPPAVPGRAVRVGTHGTGSTRPPYNEPVCPWCSVFILAEEGRLIVQGVRYHEGCAADMQTRDEDVER